MIGGITLEVREYRGIRNLVAAEVLTDTDEGMTFSAPFAVAGTSELSKSTETSSEAHYYDNQPAIVVDAQGSDEVTVNTSAVPLEIYAKLTGQYYDKSKGMVVEGEQESKYYAIGYITELDDGTEIFVWRLKGKFSIPDFEHATKDDGTDGKGQKLTYTGINTSAKFTLNGKKKTAKSVIVNTKENTSVTESKFFETVQTPDTVTASDAA